MINSYANWQQEVVIGFRIQREWRRGVTAPGIKERITNFGEFFPSLITAYELICVMPAFVYSNEVRLLLLNGRQIACLLDNARYCERLL